MHYRAREQVVIHKDFSQVSSVSKRSQWCLSTGLRLMAASGVRRPRGQRDSAAQQRLLDDFAAGAADAGPLQLAPREASFLATLSADC